MVVTIHGQTMTEEYGYVAEGFRGKRRTPKPRKGNFGYSRFEVVPQTKPQAQAKKGAKTGEMSEPVAIEPKMFNKETNELSVLKDQNFIKKRMSK